MARTFLCGKSVRSVHYWELLGVGNLCVIISTYTPRWLTNRDFFRIGGYKVFELSTGHQRLGCGVLAFFYPSSGVLWVFILYWCWDHYLSAFILFLCCLVYQSMYLFLSAIVFIARILVWLASHILSLLSSSVILGSGIGELSWFPRNLEAYRALFRLWKPGYAYTVGSTAWLLWFRTALGLSGRLLTYLSTCVSCIVSEKSRRVV